MDNQELRRLQERVDELQARMGKALAENKKPLQYKGKIFKVKPKTGVENGWEVTAHPPQTYIASFRGKGSLNKANKLAKRLQAYWDNFAE